MTIFYNILQDQSILDFAEIALKLNLVDECKHLLNSIDPNNVDTSNWLYKIYLEGKCVQNNKFTTVSIICIHSKITCHIYEMCILQIFFMYKNGFNGFNMYISDITGYIVS